MTTAEKVAETRKCFARSRTMSRNLRLGRYEGRNGGGGGATGYERRAEELARECGGELESLLWVEHRLAARVSENADLGHRRPELRARLVRVRRELRALVGS